VLFSLAVFDGLGLGEIERLFSGEGYGPAPLSEAERARLSRGREDASATAGLPAFVAEDLQRQFGDSWTGEADALLRVRAPVDLRVNGARTSRDEAAEELRGAGLEPASTPWSAWGLRLASQPSVDIQSLPAFEDGRIEIQDEGSQLAAWLADARPSQLIVDYCAGGGGKTLALAQAAEAGVDSSRLIACDVHARRLEAIGPRLARAGVAAELRGWGGGEGMDDLAGLGDLVFVDAPCSGSAPGVVTRKRRGAWIRRRWSGSTSSRSPSCPGPRGWSGQGAASSMSPVRCWRGRTAAASPPLPKRTPRSDRRPSTAPSPIPT
jgi:16S rRNA (cytosine967-C5)-methyltransferase